MKTLLKSTALVGLLCGTALTAHAQTFSNGTFTDTSVLGLAGTSANEVYGIALANGTGTQTTANGYTFISSTGSTAQADVSNINADSSGGTYNAFLQTGSGSDASSGDAVFDSVLNSGTYGGGETYTLNGLTGGNTYHLLIFTADNRPAGGYEKFEITDGTSSSALQLFFYANGNGGGGVEGGYVLDTFTEAGTGTDLSHAFTVSDPNSGIELEGILVEQVPAVPEPGTAALVGFGALSALVCVRRAKASSGCV